MRLDETAVRAELQEFFDTLGPEMFDADMRFMVPALVNQIRSVDSFEEADVLTRDEGIVLRMAGGGRVFLTVQVRND